MLTLFSFDSGDVNFLYSVKDTHPSFGSIENFPYIFY
jgi:hypothetical protein